MLTPASNLWPVSMSFRQAPSCFLPCCFSGFSGALCKLSQGFWNHPLVSSAELDCIFMPGSLSPIPCHLQPRSLLFVFQPVGPSFLPCSTLGRAAQCRGCSHPEGASSSDFPWCSQACSQQWHYLPRLLQPCVLQANQVSGFDNVFMVKHTVFH